MRFPRQFIATALLAATPAMAASTQETAVRAAIDYYKRVGRRAAFFEFTRPTGNFKSGEFYVTVYDMEGRCLAHGQQPGRVGLSFINASDADGKPFIRERIKAAKASGRGWQTYQFLNPVSKKVELKTTYFEAFGDCIFSCGSYQK
jgi:cytochrome c